MTKALNNKPGKSRTPSRSSNNYPDIRQLLPAGAQEMQLRGWDYVDAILVTADAYVDHPSFGVALIGRWLEHQGYRVAILAQPDWKSADDFRQFGPPRLFWGITSGCVDTRLNQYSSFGNKRKEDSYSPGGQAGLRPDKPLLTYAARAREAFKEVPIILGGLEASLRRLVHYDYIEDKLKRSVLIDAKADLLVHGMGELALTEIARRLQAGESIETLTDIPGTAWPVTKGRIAPEPSVTLPSLETQQQDPGQIMSAHQAYHPQADHNGKPVIQDQCPISIAVLPPARPLTLEEMDTLYDLPFTRCAHPRYAAVGGIPALETVQFSITTHRGCFGGCSFCSLYYHQGKVISRRSQTSILNEAHSYLKHPDFRGTISDVGGPTANMYGMNCSCERTCNKPSCLSKGVCANLDKDTHALMDLMRTLGQWARNQKPPVRIFVASGVRYDLAMATQNPRQTNYIELLCRDYVGGHLKVAPEHICPDILALMGKPSFEQFERFEHLFAEASRRANKEQYLVPYLISGHPGSTVEHAMELCRYLIKRNWRVRQVQDFTPIPLTLSCAMYASGRAPDGRPIHIPSGRKEKRLQMALLRYYEPQSWKLISEFLRDYPMNPAEKQKLLNQIRASQHTSPNPTPHKKTKKSPPQKKSRR